eukprot:scaffold408330_cov23-Prasinocladus_malaysianus.AAC.1
MSTRTLHMGGPTSKQQFDDLPATPARDEPTICWIEGLRALISLARWLYAVLLFCTLNDAYCDCYCFPVNIS